MSVEKLEAQLKSVLLNKYLVTQINLEVPQSCSKHTLAVGFRTFPFASLLLARSPFPGFPPSKKARTGDKSEWSNQQISALQAPIQSGCFVSDATPGRAATARTSPPFLYSSCPFLPSSRLSTCPAQLFGPFRVRLIQRSSG